MALEGALNLGVWSECVLPRNPTMIVCGCTVEHALTFVVLCAWDFLIYENSSNTKQVLYLLGIEIVLLTYDLTYQFTHSYIQ